MRLLISVLLFAATVAIGKANAATLTLTSAPANVTISDLVNISLDISGLTGGAAPGLGAYDLDIAFDPAVLSFNSASFGTGLDIFGLGDMQSVTPGSNSVNVFELALDPAIDLIAHQGSSFRLANLTFNALSSGTSALSINLKGLTDAFGNPLVANTNGTVVTVSAVPEMQSFVLMLVGLCVVAVATRKARQSSCGREA
jgi:hypothetical protein